MGFLEDFLTGAAKQGTVELNRAQALKEQQRREKLQLEAQQTQQTATQERFDKQFEAQAGRFAKTEARLTKQIAATNSAKAAKNKSSIIQSLLKENTDSILGLNTESFNAGIEQAVRFNLLSPEDVLSIDEAFAEEEELLPEQEAPEVAAAPPSVPFFQQANQFPAGQPRPRTGDIPLNTAPPQVSLPVTPSPQIAPAPGAELPSFLSGLLQNTPVQNAAPGAIAPAQDEDELERLLREIQ